MMWLLILCRGILQICRDFIKNFHNVEPFVLLTKHSKKPKTTDIYIWHVNRKYFETIILNYQIDWNCIKYSDELWSVSWWFIVSLQTILDMEKFIIKFKSSFLIKSNYFYIFTIQFSHFFDIRMDKLKITIKG